MGWSNRIRNRRRADSLPAAKAFAPCRVICCAADSFLPSPSGRGAHVRGSSAPLSLQGEGRNATPPTPLPEGEGRKTAVEGRLSSMLALQRSLSLGYLQQRWMRTILVVL